MNGIYNAIKQREEEAARAITAAGLTEAPSEVQDDWLEEYGFARAAEDRRLRRKFFKLLRDLGYPD